MSAPSTMVSVFDLQSDPSQELGGAWWSSDQWHNLETKTIVRDTVGFVRLSSVRIFHRNIDISSLKVMEYLQTCDKAVAQ